MNKLEKIMCSRCLYDSETPKISFDEKGVCNYCDLYDNLKKQFPGGKKGEEDFLKIVREIKAAGKNKKYDCVIGVSGGVDSSYLVHKVLEYGLRPLAVHYDNTWNYAVANENISKVLTKLNVDLYTYIVNNEEADDIFLSFLKASVPEIDASSDIGLASVLYIAAEKYGVQYVIEGHSFKAEGVAPLGWAYMDGKYIASIQKQFGSKKIKTFPNMPLYKFIKWIAIKRIRKIRPLWYLDYNKEAAKELLKREFDWKDYGGHHMENRISRFGHGFYLPIKFKMDQRKNAYGAAVREGVITREEGIRLLEAGRDYTKDELDNFKKRLKLTDEEFDKLIALPLKSFRDYPTYKKTFVRLKPLFFILLKFNLIPHSFYIKYTSKDEI
ncbi:MAG: N-acetyl sugar amidotransferase [Bacteroidota bacterium]|nr:N-acetyl sugar amidotransferase [Bacteroidota bacterium]